MKTFELRLRVEVEETADAELFFTRLIEAANDEQERMPFAINNLKQAVVLLQKADS